MCDVQCGLAKKMSIGLQGMWQVVILLKNMFILNPKFLRSCLVLVVRMRCLYYFDSNSKGHFFKSVYV